MSGTILCLAALLSCSITAIRGVLPGLCCLFFWGYLFGILKAHYIESNGLFIFDAATIGFYFGTLSNQEIRSLFPRFNRLLPWVYILIFWPVFVAVIPIQHYLVQVIGLRGNIFWLPMALVGFLIRDIEKQKFISFIAILNVVAFCFAVAEFFIGVDYFVPENEVTKIVHNSADLAGGAKRIPSIFANAHSYSLFMVSTIPWLLGEIIAINLSKASSVVTRFILIIGLLCAAAGIFMSGPRQPVIALAIIGAMIFFSGRFNLTLLMTVTLAGTVISYFVSQDERFQRFAELQDTNLIFNRLQVSVNISFFEILMDYPMGNGMGAGGTSLPGFAQALLSRQVIMENEYSRIMLEQGLPGLSLFLAFFFWYLLQKRSQRDPDFFLKNYIFYSTITTFITAVIGVGMMTTIPGTAFLWLGLGYSISPAFGLYLKGSAFSGRNNLNGNFSIPAYQRGLVRG